MVAMLLFRSQAALCSSASSRSIKHPISQVHKNRGSPYLLVQRRFVPPHISLKESFLSSFRRTLNGHGVESTHVLHILAQDLYKSRTPCLISLNLTTHVHLAQNG